MARVQIIQSSPNIVRIDQETTNVSITEQKTSVILQSSIIETVDEGSGSGDQTPHALVSALEVTNTDLALGDAIGRTYNTDTTFEAILSDILNPVVDSSFDNLKVKAGIESNAPQVYSTDQTLDFGTGVTITEVYATLSDGGDECVDSANLVLDVDGGINQFFTINNFGISGWEEKDGEEVKLDFTNSFDYISLQETSARTKTFSLKFELEAINSANDSYFVYSTTRKFKFYKRRWALLGTSDLATDLSNFSTFNELLSSSTQVDTSLSSSTQWSGVGVGNITSSDFFYIAIPDELYINVDVDSSINTGTADIGGAFLHAGNLTYNTGYTDSSNDDVTFDVKIYQTYQPGAFAAGTTLNILSQ